MKNHRVITTIIGLLLLSTVVLSLVSPAQAFEFEGGDKVVIAAGEVIKDDLYVGANFIEVKGTIKGDLIAFGTTILIAPEGVIEGDLMGAGQSVVISGKVMDDVRIAGAVLTLNEDGLIVDDLVAVGYSLETKSGSNIGGDLLFMGAQAQLAGGVEGNVEVNAGGVELNGSIGGDVKTDVGSPGDVAPVTPFQFMPNLPPLPSVPGGLTFGSDTQIGGDLTYTSPQKADVPSWAVDGDIEYEETVLPVQAPEDREPEPTTGEKVWKSFLGQLRRLISLLLVGLLIVWLFPNCIEQTVARLQAKPWQSLGWGALVYFGFYFLIIGLAIIVVILTILFGLMTLAALAWLIFGVGFVSILNLVLAFFIATAFITKIVVSYFVGRLILERFKSDGSLSMYWSFILGVVIFVILTAIPYIGWLINLLVIIFGLGALFLLIKDKVTRQEMLPAEKTVKPE